MFCGDQEPHDGHWYVEHASRVWCDGYLVNYRDAFVEDGDRDLLDADDGKYDDDIDNSRWRMSRDDDERRIESASFADGIDRSIYGPGRRRA